VKNGVARGDKGPKCYRLLHNFGREFQRPRPGYKTLPELREGGKGGKKRGNYAQHGKDKGRKKLIIPEWKGEELSFNLG